MVAFNQILRDTSKGLVLKPLLHSFLMNAEWPDDFSVKFSKGSSNRKPDGWFHPSQHPTWPERMLYYMVAEPDAVEPEDIPYQGTLSITVGTAMHSFIEMCLKKMGVLLTEPELRELGFEVNPRDGEPQAIDPELGSKGHMDGVLKLFLPDFPNEPHPLFEFKTSNEAALRSIEDLDLDGFKRKWPVYYGQAQDYLRMTGRQVSVVIFMQMGYPWTIREFHIPANAAYQHSIQMKYLSVRQAIKLGNVPEPCCGPGSEQAKQCPVRSVCPVGLETML